MSLSLIAVDPGKQAGLVLIERGGVTYAAKVKSQPAEPHEKLNALDQAIRRARGDVHLVVEDQYLREVSAIKALSGHAAVWESLATMRGLGLFKRVAPSSWQSMFGLAGKMFADIRKSRIREIACNRFSLGTLGKSQDVCCAALLGVYAYAKHLGWDGEDVVPGFSWVCEERALSKSARSVDAEDER